MMTRNLLVGIAFETYEPPSFRKTEERMSEESVEQMAFEVLEAVTELGYSAVVLPLQRSFLRFLDKMKRLNFDVLVNLCEGFRGRPQLEANVAAALELLEIPFTGNSSRTLALCQDKYKTKAILNAHGLPTAKARLLTAAEEIDEVKGLRFPLFVKPNAEDASLGIHPDSVVPDPAALRRQVEKCLRTYEQPVLVEEFIDGREFNVAVFDNHELQALPVSEIDFSGMPASAPRICSYEAKWFEDHEYYTHTVPVCPAKIGEETRAKLQATALAAFRATGCRDYARVDFRMDGAGHLAILEVNPNPDISLNAGYARALKARGLEYRFFWQQLLDNALRRRRPS
jgi:D-alanine-D-alanine ligase